MSSKRSLFKFLIRSFIVIGILNIPATIYAKNYVHYYPASVDAFTYHGIFNPNS